MLSVSRFFFLWKAHAADNYVIKARLGYPGLTR